MLPHQVLNTLEPIEQRMQMLQSQRMEDTNHVVTAREPAWVEQRHVPDENGAPEPATDTITRDGIEMLMDEATYECTCGEELSDWHDVQRHFQEVSDA